MTHNETIHLVFYCHSNVGCIYLIVYADDIILTGSDHHDILQEKQHLCHHFLTKDFGKLKCFLGIEIAQSNNQSVVSQMDI